MQSCVICTGIYRNYQHFIEGLDYVHGSLVYYLIYIKARKDQS